jgi:predicted esterase
LKNKIEKFRHPDIGEYKVTEFVDVRTDNIIVLEPKAKDFEHNFTLIWMHGKSMHSFSQAMSGSNKENFLNVPKDCKIILPTAPLRKCFQFWTDFDNDVVDDVADEDKPEEWELGCKRPAQGEIINAVWFTVALIKTEVTALGGDASRVFLGGCGQGVTLALASYLRVTSEIGPLGGVFCTSGIYCAQFDWKDAKIDLDVKKQTPVHLYHGSEDPYIEEQIAKVSYEELSKDKLTHIKYEVVPDLDNWINPTIATKF